MGDEEDFFQEMDGHHQLLTEIARVRLLLRDADKRGYPTQDILALLEKPRMNLKEAAKRILSARRLKGESHTRPPRR